MSDKTIDCGGRPLDLGHPRVMAILNVTPDSFSDGGAYDTVEAAVERALVMVAEGAAIIDVGGESTRPGAQAVDVQQEIDRVVPVIEALARATMVPISVDTSKPEVMRAAVAAGAGFINDVRALRDPGALEAAVELAVPVCLMHMQGEPRTMQQRPEYRDCVGEVRAFLEERLGACREVGIPQARLLIDPGFGFGKALRHNLELLRHLADLKDLGAPLLVGVSRKSMIGQMLDRPVGERLYGSITLGAFAVWQGAAVVRAHDVRATIDALRVCHAVMQAD
jgi:dihydropteroate synthase